MVRNVLSLCDKSGQFLFQVLPDRFPHGRVTMIELKLWDKFYTEQKNRRDSRKGR